MSSEIAELFPYIFNTIYKVDDRLITKRLATNYYFQYKQCMALRRIEMYFGYFFYKVNLNSKSPFF